MTDETNVGAGLRVCPDVTAVYPNNVGEHTGSPLAGFAMTIQKRGLQGVEEQRPKGVIFITAGRANRCLLIK